MICETCNGFRWVIGEDGARRCPDCKKRADSISAAGNIDKGSLAAAVRGLSALSFFPTDPMAQTVIGDAIKAMCPSVDALRYLVRRACELYRSWDKCGIPGLRQIVCAKFRPADGIESGPTESFPDGIPSETGKNPLALPPGCSKLLPPGMVESEDVEMDNGIKVLATARAVRPAAVKGRFSKLLREITTAPEDRTPIPYAEPMSDQQRAEIQAQLDAAVEANREKRGKKEAGL